MKAHTFRLCLKAVVFLSPCIASGGVFAAAPIQHSEFIADGGDRIDASLFVETSGSQATLRLEGNSLNWLVVQDVAATVEAAVYATDGTLLARIRTEIEPNAPRGFPWNPPTARGGSSQVSMALPSGGIRIGRVDFFYYDRNPPNPLVTLWHDFVSLELKNSGSSQ